MKVCSLCLCPELKKWFGTGREFKITKKMWNFVFLCFCFWSILPGLNDVMALTRALWLLYTQTFSFHVLQYSWYKVGQLLYWLVLSRTDDLDWNEWSALKIIVHWMLCKWLWIHEWMKIKNQLNEIKQQYQARIESSWLKYIIYKYEIYVLIYFQPH